MLLIALAYRSKPNIVIEAQSDADGGHSFHFAPATVEQLLQTAYAINFIQVIAGGEDVVFVLKPALRLE